MTVIPPIIAVPLIPKSHAAKELGNFAVIHGAAMCIALAKLPITIHMVFDFGEALLNM